MTEHADILHLVAGDIPPSLPNHPAQIRIIKSILHRNIKALQRLKILHLRILNPIAIPVRTRFTQSRQTQSQLTVRIL